jgi:ArsR family transcriptional regulator
MAFTPQYLFHALSDPTRLRALMLLTAEKELCVCELTHSLGLSQPMISRHLASLREAELVSDRRAGKWVYYRLHPDLPKWVRNVLTDTCTGVAGSEPYKTDKRGLRTMNNRPFKHCA